MTAFRLLPDAALLSIARAFAGVPFFLVGTSVGHAAVPTTFAMLGDASSVVWSRTILNKGDVLEVHAFKAAPGTTVELALCNDRCGDPHVVKSITIRPELSVGFTERYTLEESGHLAFWTVQPPRMEMNAGASRAISQDSQNAVAGVIHSGFSGLYKGSEVLHIIKSEFDADQVKVRFDGGRFVTVKRIAAASQTNPSGERP